MKRKNTRKSKQPAKLNKEVGIEILEQLEVVVKANLDNYRKIQKMLEEFNFIYLGIAKITDKFLESSLDDR